MQEMYKKNHSSISDDEINFQEIYSIIIKGRKTIFSIAACVLIIASLFSFLLPNIYQSNALLSPFNNAVNGISSALKGYSGLAGLAGIGLPNDDDDNNSTKAIEKLNSLSFFENNILPEIFLPDLMALKSWDYKTNKLVYDDSLYDVTSNTWIRDYSYPSKQIPSAQESFEVFQDDHLSISEDTKTGFVTVSVKHQSPFLAKEWTELLIKEINEFYRQKDKLESQKSVIYLNEQIVMTNLSEIKVVIAELLQQETQKLTLVEANEDYVFEYIDPPAIMEEELEPNRLLIVIFGMLLGCIFGFSVVLIKHYLSKLQNPQI
jgi:capsular polysaccharide biosynthesis protein